MYRRIRYPHSDICHIQIIFRGQGHFFDNFLQHKNLQYSPLLFYSLEEIEYDNNRMYSFSLNNRRIYFLEEGPE